jgi:photosystem II stability/assembly factor-like uncharacterized protein
MPFAARKTKVIVKSVACRPEFVAIFSILSFLAISSSPTLAQWEKVNVSTTASLRGLSVVSADVVWASGTGGTVIRTVDGGTHWSVLTVPGAEKLDFRGIHAFDESNAVIISSGPAEKGEARIYRTVDGGATWRQVFEEKRTGVFFDAIAFWNREHGIVLSDPVDGKFVLFTTADGGTTWKQASPAALPLALPKEGAFAASNSCLTVWGSKNVWFGTGGGKIARVFHSSDRGQTWTVSDTPMHPSNDSSGLFSLAFWDSKKGIAAGGDYAHPESSNLPNLLLTSDGGKTWTTGAATEPPGLYLSSIASFWGHGKDSLVAVGSRGAWIAEGGSNWIKEISFNLNTVGATGGQSPTIWAVGPNGVVIRSHVRYERGRRR